VGGQPTIVHRIDHHKFVEARGFAMEAPPCLDIGDQNKLSIVNRKRMLKPRDA
jgi:hypothetical protein